MYEAEESSSKIRNMFNSIKESLSGIAKKDKDNTDKDKRRNKDKN